MATSSSSIVKELQEKISVYKSLARGNHKLKETNSQLLLEKKGIIDLLTSLHLNSKTDDFYFFDCPLDVYKRTFESRFGEYKSSHLDADKADFIEAEIRKLYHPDENRVVLTENYHTFSEELENFKITITKKKEYLKEILKHEGFYMSNGPIENTSPYEDTPLDDEIRFDVLEDVRDVKVQLTANQIVILLSNAGFFSDKRIELKSQAKQAELISKITGLNVKNIATYISKLEKNSGENGANYQKDADFIDNLLNDI